MKSLYIHIGIPKTATTYLQFLLVNNEKRLAEHNILYLKSGYSESEHQYAQHELAYSLKQGSSLLWERAIKELIESPYDNGLVSSEVLSTLDEQEIEIIKKITSGLNCKIIIYLREQSSLLESLYNQAIKSGTFIKSRDEFLAQALVGDKYDYFSFLKKWEKYFGKNNLIVKLYSPKKEISLDFCNILNIDTTVLCRNKEFRNDSIDNQYIEILRLINSFNYIREEKNEFFVNPLLNFTKNEPKSGLIIYTPLEKRLIKKVFEKTNHRVAKRYFSKENLFNMKNPDVSVAPKEITLSDFFKIIIKLLFNGKSFWRFFKLLKKIKIKIILEN